jgi:hypothetical protein
MEAAGDFKLLASLLPMPTSFTLSEFAELVSTALRGYAFEDGCGLREAPAASRDGVRLEASSKASLRDLIYFSLPAKRVISGLVRLAALSHQRLFFLDLLVRPLLF